MLSRISAKTKPNKANFQNAQNECKRINNKVLWQNAAICRYKNKAKTNPIQSQNKANLWHGHLGRVFMGWQPMPHTLRPVRPRLNDFKVQSQFTPSARLGAKRSIKKVRQFFDIVYNADFYTTFANF